MALKLGAQKNGLYDGCHATPMDLHMKNYGGLDLEPKERKNYRKICYFLGIMINEKGQRFLDEGKILGITHTLNMEERFWNSQTILLGKFLIVKFLTCFMKNIDFMMLILLKQKL